jgi:hypothetical protein
MNASDQKHKVEAHQASSYTQNIMTSLAQTTMPRGTRDRARDYTPQFTSIACRGEGAMTLFFDENRTEPC